MIRTDGRPTVAMRESEPLPGQMTVEDCIEQAENERKQDEWEREMREGAPIFGGYN